MFASDQDSLCLDDPKAGVWFVNPGMSFYHTTGDTPETIDRSPTSTIHGDRFKTIWRRRHTIPIRGLSELNSEMAGEALALFDGVSESTVLTRAERLRNDNYRAELQAVVDGDDVNSPTIPMHFLWGRLFCVV